MTLQRLISFLLCSLVVSCAVPLSEDVSSVDVVDVKPNGAVDLGRVLATVEGSGSLVYLQTYKKAEKAAMGQAESLGASHLVVDKLYRKPRFWGYYQTVKGTAYRVGGR